MLAMDVNDHAGDLIPSGVASTIASMLAPTGSGSVTGTRYFLDANNASSFCSKVW